MEKPTPPGDSDCCESGCEPCVWDIYYQELALWRAEDTQRKNGEKQKAEITSTED